VPAVRERQGKTTSFAAAAVSLRRALYASKCDATLLEQNLLSLSKAAAACGCTEVLTWARAVAEERWQIWSDELCAAAAKGNQLAMMQLLQSDAELQFDAVKLAAAAAGCKSVQPATMQWICGQREPWTVAEVIKLCIKAAAADDADKLNWLHNNMSSCSAALKARSVATASIEAGALSALRWLAGNGVQLSDMMYTDCASNAAQFAVLRYLIAEAHCPWDAQTARESAAKAGTLADLQWLADRDSRFWTVAELSQLLSSAAERDELATAIWLREQGAAWPQSFVQRNGPISSASSAATGCATWSIRAMQWALASGCNWGTSWVLCYGKHEGAAAWAHAAGIPCFCSGAKLPAGIRAYCTSLQLYAHQQLQRHEGSAVTFDFDSYSLPALQPLEQHKQRAVTAAAAAAAGAAAVAAAAAVAEAAAAERRQQQQLVERAAAAAAAAALERRRKRQLCKQRAALAAEAAVVEAKQRERQRAKLEAAAAAASAARQRKVELFVCLLLLIAVLLLLYHFRVLQQQAVHTQPALAVCTGMLCVLLIMLVVPIVAELARRSRAQRAHLTHVISSVTSVPKDMIAAATAAASAALERRRARQLSKLRALHKGSSSKCSTAQQRQQ
jgi:Tfp pilus assembly major pilin PilA